MLRVYNLNEFCTKDDVDRYINNHKGDKPSDYFGRKIYSVQIRDLRKGSFYLSDDDDGDHTIWWFGPRDYSGKGYFNWFCFMTEDRKWHEFDVSTVDKCLEVKERIEQWIKQGYASEGVHFELSGIDDFLEI